MFKGFNFKRPEILKRPKLNKYYQLKHNTTPMVVTVYECPRCGYYLQKDLETLGLRTSCDRCGETLDTNVPYIPAPIENITYSAYCKGIIEESDVEYKILKIETKKHVGVLVLPKYNYYFNRDIGEILEANHLSGAKVTVGTRHDLDLLLYYNPLSFFVETKDLRN